MTAEAAPGSSAPRVSDPRLRGQVAALRVLSFLLEGLVLLAVAGSVVALGAVHPPAYRALWAVSAAAVAVLLARAAVLRRLRPVLGLVPVARHVSGRWLAVGEGAHREDGFVVDLARPLLPRPPLLLPGLLFLAWGAASLLPGERSWLPGTVAPRATLRGLAFVASALGLHLAAAAAFEARGAARRFRAAVSWLGFAVSLAAAAQLAAGTSRVYGLFAPRDGGTAMLFGPFVNRNHYAGLMLLLAPIALGLVGPALRRFARHAGRPSNWRSRLTAFQEPEGVALLAALLPPLGTIATLLATTSRGALLAFAGGLLVALAGLARRRREAPAWAFALALLATSVGWFGLERLEARFGRAPRDAPGRTTVWRDALGRLEGRWVAGTGLDTFAEAVSRAELLALPRGATPWPAEIRAQGPRPAIRVPGEAAGLAWYREAHNDWLQVLVETGLVGLALALWATFAVLRAARADPWRAAALAGLLLHVLVEFDLQVPALATLAVALAALSPHAGPSPRAPRAPHDGPGFPSHGSSASC